MFRLRMMLEAAAFTAVFMALTAVAQAQAPQTFVSAQRGDDANACTAAAPCRTFTRALSLAQAGGEVTALDSGDYEPFVVTQAATVQAAPGVYAGVFTTSTSAVTINAGANDVVVVRGLKLAGTGSAVQGIQYFSGKAVHVEDCVIDGYINGTGIAAISAGQLFISNTVVRNCFQGISLMPSSGVLKATVENSRLLKNVTGLVALNGSKVTARGTVAAQNFIGFRTINNAPGTTAEVNLEGCLSTDNGTGIRTETGSGATSLIRVADTTVTGNTNGVGIAGPGSNSILTRGNNTVEGNTFNGSFTGTFAAK